ncbi:unnamed protein product [Rotaria sordida]|uniref:Aldehyde dehydrogenase domain-containing protein n=1 Tax=Rotaria sordida TaxID=392033 RepID=A0A815VYE3_9BILA|nr:unnamed protein product [Rotaria sordida]CAF1536541.1 unnamed protein product [Rotaria sordida]
MNPFSIINPSTDEEICQVEEGTKSDPDKAIEAAENGFQYDSPWRKSDPAARAQLICKLADLLLRVVGYLAKLETLSSEKLLQESYCEILGAAVCLDYCKPLCHSLFFYYRRYSHVTDAGWADKITGETLPSESVDVTVRTAQRAVFTHAGQVCFAASRICVHSILHDAFVSKSVELAKKRIVGDPFDSTTEQGPYV